MRGINHLAQSMDNLSDKQIVERVISDDKESYGILFERYQHLVYRAALMMLGDCDMAQDVLQETFLIGYKNLERLKNPSSFAPWIAGITKNVCRGLRRARKDLAVSLDYLAEIGIEPKAPDQTNHHNEERLSGIKKTISKLPDKYREIMELRYTEGFSCKKIADFLNLSMSAVKSRLFYARKTIIKKLVKDGLL